MRNFDEQLSRMQSLMTYGMLVNESANKKGSIEYHRIASDGKSYGIFKECSKYYIKSAPADKENLAEAYDYLGGWNNRKDYEYDSFANAQKQFDLKMMSINEACGSKENAATLDPSKKGDLVIEGTDKMKAEIARQRQIMFNTATIIREGSYIGVGDPERVAGNNDEDKPYTEKGEAKLDKDMPKASGDPEDQSNPYGDGKAAEKGKDVKDGDVLSDGKAVAADHPSGGEVTHVKNLNEDCDGGCCAPNGARDWGTEGIGKGNGDPKENGWEMEGQEYVNEEINDAKEWDEGLPGSAGTGEADTDHNNDPFKENVNEAEEGEDEYDVEGGDAEAEADGEAELEAPIDGDSLGDEEIPELGGEEEIDLGDEAPEEDEFDDESGDLEAEIEELRAEIEALKAQIEGGEEEPIEDEPLDEPVGDELGGEEDVDLGGEEIPDDEEPIDEGAGLASIRAGYRAGRTDNEGDLDKLSQADRDRFIATGDIDGDSNINYDAYKGYADKYKTLPRGSEEALGTALDAAQARPGFMGRLQRRGVLGAANVGNAVRKAANGFQNFKQNTVGLEEAKQAYMDNLVNEIVAGIMSESKRDDEWKKRFDFLYGGNPFNEKEMDKKFGDGAAKKAYGDTSKTKKDAQECVNEETTVLHDFGKHPGYRKKPMDLPATGSDNENGMRDWNDDSVHSEEPFGKSIGDGKPYDELVKKITDSVMEAIKKKV